MNAGLCVSIPKVKSSLGVGLQCIGTVFRLVNILVRIVYHVY